MNFYEESKKIQEFFFFFFFFWGGGGGGAGGNGNQEGGGRGKQKCKITNMSHHRIQALVTIYISQQKDH